MTTYKIICESEDEDQYIDADNFSLPSDGNLLIFDDEEIMVAAFSKDFWKAIRIANDLLPFCKSCGGMLEELVRHHCEKCGDNGDY